MKLQKPGGYWRDKIAKSIWPLPQEKRLTHFVLIIIIAFSFTTNCVKSITDFDFTLDALNYVLNANYQLFAVYLENSYTVTKY